MREYLEPTAIIDSDHPEVKDFALRAVRGAKDPVERAILLYLAVRDSIRYDPYSPFWLPEHYRASWVISRGRGFCVPKASLLCALGRVFAIPSRVGFATVRNHLATRQLLEFLGTDLFVYHGYVDFFLEGKWVKCTPAFNRELCQRHNVLPLEFDGRNDSVFQPYNSDKQRYMEYVEFTGAFADIPVSEIVSSWKKTYGEDFLEKSQKLLLERKKARVSDFENEEVWSG
ncbi:MAG: transglutaminase-like domain-containing protein [Syntrophobacteraceae bacterium]|nr:transglutaminase-like domain-containing protein [Syntrophobacteraceae bacterium]